MTSGNVDVQQAESASESGATAEESNGGADADRATRLSLDVIFEILKNGRRRAVLEYLMETGESVSLGDLAEHVAARENDKPVSALTSGERKRVYVGLYQCHLPKMDDAGIVEFERNRGHIALGENADQLEEYLGGADERPLPWHRYYLAIASAGAVLLAASAVAQFPFEGMVGAAVVGALLVCSSAHTYARRDDEDDE